MDRRDFLRLGAKAFLTGTVLAVAPAVVTGNTMNESNRRALWTLRRLEKDYIISTQQAVIQAVVDLGPDTPQWAQEMCVRDGLTCKVHIPIDAFESAGLDYHTSSVQEMFDTFVREHLDLDVVELFKYRNKESWLGALA